MTGKKRLRILDDAYNPHEKGRNIGIMTVADERNVMSGCIDTAVRSERVGGAYSYPLRNAPRSEAKRPEE